MVGALGWVVVRYRLPFHLNEFSKHLRARNGVGVKRVANMKKEHQNTPKIFWHPVFRFELKIDLLTSAFISLHYRKLKLLFSL